MRYTAPCLSQLLSTGCPRTAGRRRVAKVAKRGSAQDTDSQAVVDDGHADQRLGTKSLQDTALLPDDGFGASFRLQDAQASAHRILLDMAYLEPIKTPGCIGTLRASTARAGRRMVRRRVLVGERAQVMCRTSQRRQMQVMTSRLTSRARVRPHRSNIEGSQATVAPCWMVAARRWPKMGHKYCCIVRVKLESWQTPLMHLIGVPGKWCLVCVPGKWCLVRVGSSQPCGKSGSVQSSCMASALLALIAPSLTAPRSCLPALPPMRTSSRSLCIVLEASSCPPSRSTSRLRTWSSGIRRGKTIKSSCNKAWTGPLPQVLSCEPAPHLLH